MPVSFNSPARNLFLLGSSGGTVVTNFFKTILDSSTDGVFSTKEISYNYSEQNYILSGSASNSNSVEFGWIEKRDYDAETDPDNPTSTVSFANRVQSTTSSNLILNDIELDSNNNIIACGISGSAPWIAKYSNAGVLDWQSTTNSGDVEYKNITSDSNNEYYASGNTNTSNSITFIEKFDSSGNPLWGKSAVVLGRDIQLNGIAVNDRSEVVSVGWLEDDSRTKAYIVKVDTVTGSVLWDKTFSSSEKSGLVYTSTQSEDVFIDTEDNIYMVGKLYNTNDSSTKSFIIKLSPEGNIIWQKETDENIEYYRVKADGDTGQVVTFGRYYDSVGNDQGGLITKYTRGGDISWRRSIFSSYNGSDFFGSDTINGGGIGLDADASFYYVLYTDDEQDGLNGTPTSYTFGKISTSGNGLGGFEYDDGQSETVYYDILNSAERIGRLSDGSVRNDTSDLITYPFNATRIAFDDYATPVSNKKRQMDSADSFEYSGSPAIRPADFQELNLLGDVYSGSGDWLDQSGKGNDATTVVTTTTTTTTGGTTESENFGTGGSITYNTYGTVVEGVTATLPYSTSDWDHYNSKVRDLQSGGFKITTSNSATTDFFMGCWVKFEDYEQSRQMGINLAGNYVYWETRSNGKVGIRHDGGSREDSAETNIDDENWHYISLSRSGNTLAGHVDGISVVSTTDGVSGNIVPTNADFWFFGGSGTSYNFSGKILDPIINIGSGQTGSYTTPTKPIIDSSGNFNDGSSGTGPFFNNTWEYASPAIALGGSTTTTTTTSGPTHNADGYWEFDSDEDRIVISPSPSTDLSAGDFTISCWFFIPTSVDTTNLYYDLMSIGDSTSTQGTWYLKVWRSGIAPGCIYSRMSGVIMIGTDGPLNSFYVGDYYKASGRWTHFTFIEDNGTSYYYINGYQTGSISTPTIQSGQNYIVLGDREDAGNSVPNGLLLSDFSLYQKPLTAAQVFQNYNATKSKYINEAPDTAPKITSDGILVDSSLLLYYDFGNRATYDPATNKFTSSANLLKYSDGTAFGRLTDWSWLGASTPEAIPNAAIAPDGSLTAWKVSGPSLYQSIINDGDFTMSAWVKTVDGSSASVQQSVYLLGTGGDVLSTTHTATGEWQRITFSSVATSIYGNPAGKYHRYTPFSSSADLYVWGPQVELKSSAGRHVQTYGTAINLSYGINSLVPTETGGTFNDEPKNQFIDGTVKCNGTYEFITFSNPSITVSNGSSSTVSWTAELWIKPDAYTGSSDIADLLSDGTYRIELEQGGSDAGKIRYNYSSTSSNFSNVALTAGQWNHVVVKFSPFSSANSVSIQAWINNTFALNTGHTEPLQQIVNRSGVGFLGRIAELKIYDKDLTDAEREGNWNATRGKYGV